MSYDALGRLTRQASNVQPTGTALSYDAAGRLTRMTWQDGFFVTYDYDQAGAVTAIRENGGFVLASYGYDDLGRRTSISRGNGTTTSYSYTSLSQLLRLKAVLTMTGLSRSTLYRKMEAGTFLRNVQISTRCA